MVVYFRYLFLLQRFNTMKQQLKTITVILQFFAIVLIAAIVYIGQSIVVPFFFALITAITLLPVYRFFRKLKIGEVLSILCCIVVAFTILSIITFVLSTQFTAMLANKDDLKFNISKHLQTMGSYIQSKTGYSIEKQAAILQHQLNVEEISSTIVVTTASSISSLVVWLGVVPVYIFLFLYYKNLLLRFIFLGIDPTYHNTIKQMVSDSELTVKNYLNGLLLEMLFVGILLWAGLTIFGIDYALLMAATFAVLNMIPYVGSLVATVLIALVTLSTSPHLSHTWIALIVMIVVQIIDNNVIMTYLVSSKVKINALVTVIAVVIGEALAGVGGMFLAIPCVAILKLIFDKIESLKHWGLLFGEDIPKLNPLTNPALRLKRKFFQFKNNTKPEIDTNNETNSNP